MRKYRYNRYIQLIKPPSPSLNINQKKMINILKSYNRKSKVLDIGCGSRRLADHLINYDLEPASNIDVVGDAQSLPFNNDTFDLIICQAVLEHVQEPSVVVAEIHRILKNGGVLYVEVPFLQGFHADPHDYTRFTLSGIEYLLRKYKRIESGVCVGPFSVLAWWLRKFPTVIFKNSLLAIIVEFFFGWFTFWIKYFDISFIHFKNSHILAAGIFYLGEK